jgi:hypothetical protein
MGRWRRNLSKTRFRSLPEFLTAPLAGVGQLPPLEVAVRLLAALLLGGVVSLAYRFTRRGTNIDTSFSITLALLCVLIAMVTQVIGDSIARAFGLVGALSIVRFRTVVRDTQDTAYVIFAVVVGMAVGARSPWVAVIGIAAVVLAELCFTRFSGPSAGLPEYLLTMRAGLDCDLDTIVPRRQLLCAHASRCIAVGASQAVRRRSRRAERPV